MTRIARPTTVVILLLALAGGCGGGPSGPDDGSDGGPGGPGGSSGANLLSARIDGAEWAADAGRVEAQGSSRVAAIRFSGSTGTVPARVLSVDLSRIPGPGTYPLGMNLNTATGGIATVTIGAQTWSTPLDGAAGSVTISSITDTRIAGTFRFEAAALLGSTTPARIVVTDGQFNVPRHPSYLPATPDELGSRVAATIGGASFNAATVSAGVTSFTASNLDYSVTVIGPAAGPGTYPLGGGWSMVVQRAAGGAWGGTAVDQGAITITSVSAARIAGTFSASLAPPFQPNAPPLEIVNGSFDLRIP